MERLEGEWRRKPAPGSDLYMLGITWFIGLLI